MFENKISLKSITLLERLKQDDGLIGCAVAHALEVECASMDNCSACSVETCNRLGKLIWQDMNDYMPTCKVDGKNIFDLRREYAASVDENSKLRELNRSHDRLVDDNHALTGNLVRALNAKPDYAELHAFIADLEKCILDISEAVNDAIEAVNGYETK